MRKTLDENPVPRRNFIGCTAAYYSKLPDFCLLLPGICCFWSFSTDFATISSIRCFGIVRKKCWHCPFLLCCAHGEVDHPVTVSSCISLGWKQTAVCCSSGSTSQYRQSEQSAWPGGEAVRYGSGRGASGDGRRSSRVSCSIMFSVCTVGGKNRVDHDRALIRKSPSFRLLDAQFHRLTASISSRPAGPAALQSTQ